MKRVIWITFLAAVLVSRPLRAQLKLDLDSLAAKATESVNVSLDASMLRLAGGFFSAQKSTDAEVKDLVSKLKGIYVRSFEFAKEGQYTQADLQLIRDQLKTPGWSKIVSVQEDSAREGAEIYLRTEGGQTAGIAILAFEAKELTVVNIVGPIDLGQLAGLTGRFGIPALPATTPKKATK